MRKIFTKNDIFKSFFILFLFILTIFVFINSNYLQFVSNGFNKIANTDLQVYYLDVGQASASVVIMPNGASMIIDTGSQASEEQFLSSVDLIFSQNKIKSVDYLVLTHSDEDHVGGAVALLDKYQVHTIYRPKVMSQSEKEVENIFGYKEVDTQIYSKVISSVLNEPNCDVLFVEDVTMHFGMHTTVKFWTAKQLVYSQTNSYSPFITIDFAGKTFMFTGDATASREKEFLNQLTNSDLSINVDFLAVSHHGSASSSTAEFLQAIDPQYAFISAGDNLHPSQEVLQRLKEVEIKNTYVTKDCGMIAVGLDENQKFIIKYETTFVDAPLICVVLACFAFMVAKLDFNRKKFTNFQMQSKKLSKIQHN